ncbi:winged helix DNA-binding domain-containing protein [Microbacterium abyssi]|uniref:winged helix DNA-binding domain-containing protein n=1 Tax=Microbacterium abyssi TaxID=2782166 RepID=UPI001887732E|nr:winged helix DNA-binding domain-containing protein [Microbacterium sp. A18JL241]
MEPHALRAERLRSHRLTAPARSVADAARHLLAVQAQEFWAGRWALAARTSTAPTLRAVDRLFNRGVLIRAWTQRGTLHILPAEDLAWVLAVTGERQLRMAAPRYRELGLGPEELLTVERVLTGALRGGNAMTRAQLFAVLANAGIDPTGQRGLHAVQNLALRGIVCQGPVVPRPEGASREQLFVLAQEHIGASAAPAAPAAEMFARYIVGHGPATAEDFAWWAGITLGTARAAASVPDERIHEVDEGVFAARTRPRRSPRAASVIALGPFEEYYISYQDRSVACPPEHLAAVGPGKNGMVRPIIVSGGVVVGTWRHSTAIGRHADDPVPELLTPGAASDEDVAAALDRYAAFITG